MTQESSQLTAQKEFPKIIPFISASGIVLLPGGLLPYNTHKSGDLKAIDHALARNRYIGVVQPMKVEGDKKVLFRIGGLGKISTFTEGIDGSYFLIINGLMSFSVLAEPRKGFLQVDYLGTPLKGEPTTPLDRMKLLNLLNEYLKRHGILINWEDIMAASDESLVTSLAMICPFNVKEKQAILESRSLREQFQMLTAFMEISQLKKLDNMAQLH